MFPDSFFGHYRPDSFYTSPFDIINQRQQRPQCNKRSTDVNNNQSETMNRQAYEDSYFDRQRQAQLERQRRYHQQQQYQHQQHQYQQRRRPVVYRPKPFEAVVDISDLDIDELHIRFVDGALIIRAPGDVRYGFSLRRMMIERRLPLPDDIIEEQIECQLDRYGRLKVTAPRKSYTRYESDDQHQSSDDDEIENHSALQPVRNSHPPMPARLSLEAPSPRSSSPVRNGSSPSVPTGSRTEQSFEPQSTSRLSGGKKTKPKRRYEFTECDSDVTVEDIYD